MSSAEPRGDWRQPTLAGDRLLLRPLDPSDWSALYAIASDRLIWEQHPARDRWREEVFREFFDDALALGGAIAVIERASGAIIGSSRWQGHDVVQSVVEIGWTFLARHCWRTGRNHELKRLMLAHAFHHVETVTFHIGVNNMRSRRAVESIGSVLTDRTVLVPRYGAQGLHVIYEITREAFASGPLSRARDNGGLGIAVEAGMPGRIHI